MTNAASPATDVGPPGIGDRVRSAVRTLTPGYFALIMASGIISVGLKLVGSTTLSTVLLVVAAVAYVVLVLLNGWRLVSYRESVADDFADPRRAFGFFTFVAGTNVLGARLAMADQLSLTSGLLVVSGLTWFVLGYVIPWTAVLGHEERPVLVTANGTWFIWVVASQSVAVVAATLEPRSEHLRHELAVLAVMSWSVGIFLYAAAGILVSLRLMLYELRPEDLTPPYFVSMGALAITVLAGARIVEMAEAPMIDATRGLIAGLAVVCWAFATWLIPVLLAAGWWRHFRRRVPLAYDATLWSVIFPLGMYAVAGIYLGHANKLPIVGAIGKYELWIALASWLVTFTAMIRHVIITVVRGAQPAR